MTTGQTLPTTTKSIDRAQLDAVLMPIVRAHGAEVVDVEFKSESGGWVLRVFVEKLGSADGMSSTKDAAVALSVCSAVARELSPALDVADFIPHRYHLEVSSPGVERPLKTRRDYERFAGKKAKLRLSAPVRGQKVITGILGALEGDVLSVTDDAAGSQAFPVPLRDITAARLVFEFGPAPFRGKPNQHRPGKKSSKGK